MLGKKSLVWLPVPLITESLKELHFERSKILLNILKKEAILTLRIFSDEKIFKFHQVYNCRNDRIIVDQQLLSAQPSIQRAVWDHCLRWPEVSVHLCSGQHQGQFECHIEHLESKIVPWLKKTYPTYPMSYILCLAAGRCTCPHIKEDPGLAG